MGNTRSNGPSIIEFDADDVNRLCYIASASRRGPSAKEEILSVIQDLTDKRARLVAYAIAKHKQVLKSPSRIAPANHSIALTILKFAGV